MLPMSSLYESLAEVTNEHKQAEMKKCWLGNSQSQALQTAYPTQIINSSSISTTAIVSLSGHYETTINDTNKQVLPIAIIIVEKSN